MPILFLMYLNYNKSYEGETMTYVIMHRKPGTSIVCRGVNVYKQKEVAEIVLEGVKELFQEKMPFITPLI